MLNPQLNFHDKSIKHLHTAILVLSVIIFLFFMIYSVGEMISKSNKDIILQAGKMLYYTKGYLSQIFT